MNIENSDKYNRDEQAKYFLAAIAESSQDSIVTVDLNRVITSWNKAAEILYGYKAEEVIGKSLDVVMLPEDVLESIKKVETIARRISVPIYETVRLHKNGKAADLQIALTPVKDSTGAVIGISTIARDITEAKLQQQLKDEFIAIASHELKTPVTSIKVYTEILVERFKDDIDKTSFTLMKRLDQQVDRLTELIKNLLDTVKLSRGEVLLDIQPFDLSALIEEQIEVTRHLLKNHQINFNSEKDQIVSGDKKLISQVLKNLISNAIKYSPKGGKIIITSLKAVQGTEISVQDFGIGIPEGLNHKIFEKYFRVDNQHERQAPGIGLGLYVTAQIVQQHGGKIYVASKEGVGTTFSFTLPQNEPDETGAAPNV
ncbi:MAG: PAS domain S-box protein [Chitinophagaceae bacterium]|nr:PAS domain S-box protein [Chitinophagaceae bacterium]